MFSICCGGTELRWTEYNPWFWRQLCAFLSIYWGDKSEIQCTLAVHKPATCSHTPMSGPKTQPWASAHNSATCLYADKPGVCGFTVLPEHREEVTWGMTPGSLPLGVGHSTNVGGNTRMRNRNVFYAFSNYKTLKCPASALNNYWFYLLLLSKEMETQNGNTSFLRNPWLVQSQLLPGACTDPHIHMHINIYLHTVDTLYLKRDQKEEGS